MPRHYKSGEGSLWVQPGGPGTEPEYLGCHGLGDVDKPEGDIELIFCPDPSGPNRFMVVGSIEGAAGGPTTTITTDVMDEFDELEELRCPFPLYINLVPTGRRDVFGNAARIFVITNARITNRGLSNLAARTPDDNARSEQTFDIAGEELLRLSASFSAVRQSISETEDINDITFCNDETCLTTETRYQQACEEGYAVASAGVGVTANVLRTTDGGTWAATAADPFAADEDIIAVECFDLGGGDIRVVVARGTTDAAAAAEIAYTDDGGANWNTVDVGAVVGAFAPHANALFALDSANMWMGTDDGYLYYSNDGGLTWEAQESGTIQTGDWNAVDFATTEIGWVGGAANSVMRTVDGGNSWEEITGPTGQGAANVVAVDALDEYRAFIGYDDGTVWKTVDGGLNWSQVSFSGSGVGAIRSIEFKNEILGMIVRNDGSGVGHALITVNGGYTWRAATVPTNTGFSAAHWCTNLRFYLAGAAQGGTGMIARATA